MIHAEGTQPWLPAGAICDVTMYHRTGGSLSHVDTPKKTVGQEENNHGFELAQRWKFRQQWHT